jgi:hypothetical protein
MKVWKKLSAVALALVMVMALCVMASATGIETNSTDEGVINATKGIESAENTLKIAKEIIFVNAEETQVREPNITYTYTITAVDTATLGGATVTGLTADQNDAADLTMTTTVKAGRADAVTGSTDGTTSTVVFVDTTKATATATGTPDTKYALFTFTPTKFPEAGIYRYKIEETLASGSNTKAQVGIVAANKAENVAYNADRYLDVYVKWKADRTQGLEIYGYVLFEGSADQTITNADVTMKSKGYVNTSDSSQANVDVYTTQNLLITGATTGALADKTNLFPVSVTLTKAEGLTDGIKLDVAVDEGKSTFTTSSDTLGNYVVMGSAINGTLKDEGTITITGIPANSTVVMSEQNNTHDSYRVKVGTTANTDNKLAEATVAANGTSSDTLSSTLSAKVSLYITNTLDAISPTGVTLRFAPYMAMLGAGIVALPLSLRKKEEEL